MNISKEYIENVIRALSEGRSADIKVGKHECRFENYGDKFKYYHDDTFEILNYEQLEESLKDIFQHK